MRGWMIAAVSTLVASGAWAGLRVGTERAPEPKVVAAGIGLTEPIDTEGYTEIAIHNLDYGNRLGLKCSPVLNTPPLELKVKHLTQNIPSS